MKTLNIRIASPTQDYSNTLIVYDGAGLTLVILTVISSLYTHQTVDYCYRIIDMVTYTSVLRPTGFGPTATQYFNINDSVKLSLGLNIKSNLIHTPLGH